MLGIFIYTDASFSKTHSLAVAGFLSFSSAIDHAASKFTSANFHTTTFTVENNIRAELMAVLWALELVSQQSLSSEVCLYTDCQTVIDLPQRRLNLEAKSFVSGKTGKLLRNADLYQKFYLSMDKLPVKMLWVKGHVAKDEQSVFQKNFSYIDQHVRKKLRENIAV